MNKRLTFSILALCLSFTVLFGQSNEITYKQNAFGLDLGIGGTSYNDDWWGKDTGAATTFDIGFRYLHNFSPYFGVDFFKFKLPFIYKNVDDIDFDYFGFNPQLMTGVRGYSPSFTSSGMRAFGAFRLGAGVLVNTFTDFDETFTGVGGGFCFEFEVGMYLNHTVFVAFAYNYQGGSVTFENDYKADIGASYPAFRIGFDFGGRKVTHKRGGGKGGKGGGGGGGSGSGAGASNELQAEPKTQPVAVTEERQIPCYTIEEMKELIRNNMDIRGKKICAIKQVNFEFGKSTLTKDDKLYLDEIVDLMKQNKQIHVKVNGHTDNIGTEEFNKNLSRDRAKSVYEYLKSKGIAASRLSYDYFGATQPIADNSTDEGRAINRRVEFEIVSQ